MIEKNHDSKVVAIPVSSKRLNEVDFMKTIAIIGMIFIHVLMNLFSECMDVEPYKIIVVSLFGGALAAPVFMFAMGIGIVYTRHNRPIDFFMRGIVLLVVAISLNIVRAVIPLYIVAPDIGTEYVLTFALAVDILTFAGMSFVLIGLLKCLRMNRWHILVIAIAMWAFSQIVGTVEIGGYGIIAGIFVYTTSFGVYFSLCNWFIVVAMGIFVGYYLKERNEGRGIVYRGMFVIGAILFALGTLIMVMEGNWLTTYFEDEYFYSLHPATLMWSMGLVFMVIPAVFFMLNHINSERINKVTFYLSSNLNRIYILQWVIIMWVFTFEIRCGLMPNDPIWYVPFSLAVLAASIALLPLYERVTRCIRKHMAESRSEL